MAYQTINPATGEKGKTYDMLTDQQMFEKLDLAQSTFEQYCRKSFEDRAEIMRKAARQLDDEKDRWAEMITREMGKPISQSLSEVEKCGWVCRYYADNAAEFLDRQQIKTDASASFIQYDPLGVLYAIMPWNFPFWQLFRFAAPALMAGNTALLKHSDNVPECAAALEEIFLKAGFPKGAFQNLYITHDQSDKLIADHRIRGVTLTGSGRAGSHVASQAGKHLKKHVLELGGSDPFIVLEDADVEKAVEVAIKARYQNAGQSCIAAKRFILHQDIADNFLSRFRKQAEALNVGDPMEQETFMGPMARQDLVDDLHQQVQDSLKAGAELVAGGNIPDRKGFYYTPTIIKNPPKDSPAYKDELFGPVATVFVVKDEEEAIRIANDTMFGLGSSLWTNDKERAGRLSHQINAGNVFINDMVKSHPHLPFGGVKDSGYGRELSVLGIHEWVNCKTVWLS